MVLACNKIHRTQRLLRKYVISK